MSQPLPCTLITGATGGLGQYFVEQAAQSQSQPILLIGRDKKKLESVAQKNKLNNRAICIEADLSDTATSIKIIEDALIKNHLWVETLINNAGFGLFGTFAETEIQTEQEMISVNITTLTALTKLVLPQMTSNNRGNILNVASVAGFFPGPFMSVYFATKAYVLSFTLALKAELQNTNIHVTALCPGSTDTGFIQEAKAESASIFQGKLADPQSVAAFGWRSLQQNKGVAIHGQKNFFIVALTRIFPLSLLAQLSYKVQNKS